MSLERAENGDCFTWPRVDTAAFPCKSEGSCLPEFPSSASPSAQDMRGIRVFQLWRCLAFQSSPSQKVPVPFCISHRILFENSPGKAREADQWGEPGLFSLLVSCSSRLCGELPKPLSLWHSIKLLYSRSGSNMGSERQGLGTAPGRGERSFEG